MRDGSGREGRLRGAVRAGAAVALLAAACGGSPEPAAETRAEGAERGAAAAESVGAAADSAELLADRVLAALGGREAWERTRYLAFRWVVARGDGEPFARSHAWDRYEGRYRLAFGEGEEAVLAHFDVNSVRRDSVWGKVPEGRVWVGGEPLAGTAADSALASAYGAFINDTYWLLMPFKWRDPGVHLTYEGRRPIDDGEEYAVVHLAFEPDLGVTNDEYWAYVDPETGRMVAWRYHLQRQEEPGPVIRWTDWRRVGKITLASGRVWPDGRRRLWFEELVAAEEVPEGAFEPPGAP